MDDLHNWILFGHIIGATVWFGGHVLLEGLGASAKKAGEPAAYTAHMQNVGRTSSRIMPIAGLMTLGFGIWLVLDSAYEFSDIFVSIGFLVVIVGFGIGLGFLTPGAKKLDTLVAEQGIDSSEANALAHRLAKGDHVMTGIVFLAMVVMIFKF